MQFKVNYHNPMTVKEIRRCSYLLLIFILGIIISTKGQPTFSVPNLTADPSNSISVPVKIDSFLDITTVQFTLEWDPAVITPSSLNLDSTELRINEEDNFQIFPDSGLLSFLWFDKSANGVSIEDGSSIFEVNFLVTSQPGLNTSIIFSDRVALREVADTSFLPIQTNYIDGSIQVTGTSSSSAYNLNKDLIELLPISPNPMLNQATLQYRLKKAVSARLFIQKPNGQTILNRPVKLDPGINELVLDRSVLNHSGIYFIQLIGKDIFISQKLMVH